MVYQSIPKYTKVYQATPLGSNNMLGLATSFIIALSLAVALGYYTNNAWNGVVLILLYAGVKVAWKILK